MADTSSKQPMSLLIPQYIQSVSGLNFLARMTVANLMPGIHTSNKVGMGQEFSQYRTYQPGDDIRKLDWKVMARTDRYYIKEAELQSHITLRFVIDTSASMNHRDGAIAKIDFVKYMVATLAYLAQLQGDPTGLNLVNDQKPVQLTPRFHPSHFQHLLYTLTQLHPAGKIPPLSSLEQIVPNRKSKDIYIVITDMYEQANELHELVKLLSSANNEVLLFHIMGRNEMELSFPGGTLEDLETGKKLVIHPPRIKASYKQTLDKFIHIVRKDMLSQGVTYDLFVMDEAIGQALMHFLQRRMRLIN